jgi:hypothetical protein
VVIHFLKEQTFQVYIKKKVLNLIGLLLDLNLPYMQKSILTSLMPSLKGLGMQYFPVKTRDLEKSTTKAVNFEQIVEGFLDLIDFSQNYTILRMLD